MAKGDDDTIYFGGFISASGGLTFNNLAAWSPTQQAFSTLSTGVNDMVFALAVAPDDSVYIGGYFENSGNLTNSNLKRIARWSPHSNVMSALATGVNGIVQDLSIKDDTLYLGGSFTQSDGGSTNGLLRIAQWGPLSGSTPAYAPLSSGLSNTVEAVHAPATDTRVYAGGSFTNRFTQWGPIPSSPSFATVGSGLNNIPLAITSSRDDTIFVGGLFTAANSGAPLRRIAAWTPGALSDSGYSELGSGLNSNVSALAVDDTSRLLYAAGEFTFACGTVACSSSDDTTPLNYVGAFDLRTRKWVPLATSGTSGVNAAVNALVVDDSEIYIGGGFSASSSGTSLSGVAKWTWSPPSGNATILHSGNNSTVVPGQSFVGVTGVTIGGSPAQVNYAQSTSTQLAVTVPGLPTGNHPIVVTAVGGTATVGTYSIPVPSAPVVTASAGQTSVDLSWTLDDTGGSAVTYLVALGTTSNIVNTTTNTMATLTGLNPGTTYTVYVRAINNNGPGPWSTGVSATTQSPPAPPAPALPPGAPSVASAAPGNAEATVTWTPPADTGTFPIDAYTVRTQPGGQTCTTSSTACTVTGLTNGTPYTFTVTASSAAGTGPASSPSAPVTPRTISGPPVGVTAKAGDTRATITWSPPTDDGGNPITGYRVTTIPTSQGCTVSTTTCTIEGLTNDQQYVVSVVATNVAGSSAPATATVTPRGMASIVITGTRSRNEPALVKVLGTVTNLDIPTVQPYVRLARQTTFQPALTQAAVGDEGRFRWQRITSKRITIYVEAGDVRSNAVTIAPQ